MRIVPVLGFCCGLLTLSWAAESSAAVAGTASATTSDAPPATASARPPAIRISSQQNGLAGTCGGSGFDVNTNIDVTSQASANVELSAPGVGVIEEFTDETGKNIGPYSAQFPTFHIPPFGGGLAPNTPITLTVTTYSGPSLTGSVTSVSKLVFNCTTGAVIEAPARGFATMVPTLSPFALGALAALLALIAATARRPSGRRVSRGSVRR